MAQMSSPIDMALTRLDGVTHAGKSYKALCPAHGDKTPSLSVKEGDDGRVLLYCFAGCGIGEIVAAIGMRMVDLFICGASKQYASKIPGVSAQELRAAMDHERLILFIVNADQRAGRSVPQSDLDRTKIALDRIAMVRRIL